MVQHMHTKSKQDSRTKYQLKLEDISSEEYYIQHFLNPNASMYNNDMNLDNFFNIRTERCESDDKVLNENLFMKEIRYFSLKEQYDTLSLSTGILENEEMFAYFLEQFSLQGCFNSFCT